MGDRQCRQCFSDGAGDDGFCCDECERKYNAELTADGVGTSATPNASLLLGQTSTPEGGNMARKTAEKSTKRTAGKKTTATKAAPKTARAKTAKRATKKAAQ